MEDQLKFAEVSGDFNPIHLDPLVARRSMYGEIVVHGIHQLLWALNEISSFRKQQCIDQVSVEFISALCVQEPVSFVSLETAKVSELNFFSGSLLLTKAKIWWKQAETQQKESHAFINNQIKNPTELPKTIEGSDMPDQKGCISVSISDRDLGRLFPSLMNLLPAMQLATIITTSRLVGMYCPGMYSIYSELRLIFNSHNRDESNGERLNYCVSRWDRRFGRAEISLQAAFSEGQIKAFMRPREKEFPPYTEFLNRIGASDFSGQNALIIGGSRGIGREVVSMLSAGGANVIFTYAQCESEAQQLKHEISGYGGSVDCFKLDVLNNGRLVPEEYVQKVSLCNSFYYFATPPIFMSAQKMGAEHLARHFSDFYVIGFKRVFKEIKGYAENLKACYYPSTISVEENSNVLTEYSTVKLQAEELCHKLSTETSIQFKVSRLPRMDTDQTQSIFPVPNKAPFEVMYKELLGFKFCL